MRRFHITKQRGYFRWYLFLAESKERKIDWNRYLNAEATSAAMLILLFLTEVVGATQEA